MPFAVPGSDQHDDLVLDAKLVADVLVVQDFGRSRGTKRMAVRAQFQPENSRRGGQGNGGQPMPTPTGDDGWQNATANETG